MACDDQTVMNEMYRKDLRIKLDDWKIVDQDPDAEREPNSTHKNTCHSFSFNGGFPSRVAVSPVTGIKVVVWNSTLTPRGNVGGWDCERIDQLWVAMPVQGAKKIGPKLQMVEKARERMASKKCN